MRDVMVVIGGLAETGPGEGGKTALEAARTPTLDQLATDGILGMTRLAPADGVPTTTATTLAALGYDPAVHRVAPGVAVAVGLGAPLDGAPRVAVLDLVTAGVDDAGREIVGALGGAHLTRAERAAIAAALRDALAPHGVTVHGGPQAAVVVDGQGFLERPGPPWAALGGPLAGPPEDAALYRVARMAIQDAPVVAARRSGGAPVPTDVWVWGGGEPPAALPPFGESGMVLADEPVVLGIARLVGLETDTLGAPEEADGAWEPCLPAIVRALERHVFVLVHVDLVDALGHRRDVAGKAAAIEALDHGLVAPLWRALEERGGDWRMAVLAGHAVHATTRAHVADPVPFVVYAGRPEYRATHPRRRFNERDAREQGIYIPDGHGLIARLTRR